MTETSSAAIPAATDAPGGNSPALAELVGDRRTLQQIATALGCTERAVYSLIDRHRIPYLRVLSKRYVDPKDIRDALLRDQSNAPTRGRGRPRKIS